MTIFNGFLPLFAHGGQRDLNQAVGESKGNFLEIRPTRGINFLCQRDNRHPRRLANKIKKGE